MRNGIRLLVVVVGMVALLSGLYPGAALADTSVGTDVGAILQPAGSVDWAWWGPWPYGYWGAGWPYSGTTGWWGAGWPYWGGGASWPWWGGMPLGQISALTNYTWPWYSWWGAGYPWGFGGWPWGGWHW